MMVYLDYNDNSNLMLFETIADNRRNDILFVVGQSDKLLEHY